MLPESFLIDPVEGHEVAKFKTLLDAFDAAWSYETGFDDVTMFDFRYAINSMDVQLMEMLRILIERPDFEELAKESNKKYAEVRRKRPMKIRRIGEGR